VKRKPIVLLALLAFLTAAYFLGKRTGHQAAPGATAARLLGEVKGAMAPEFALTSLDGKTVRLAEYRGRAVLLNFWATWCTPCRIEMPWFVEFQKQYGPQGLVVIGVAMDDASTEAISRFARGMKVNYLILQGNDCASRKSRNV
jgi:thiol-disulfide isomerase/thioredoxin